MGLLDSISKVTSVATGVGGAVGAIGSAASPVIGAIMGASQIKKGNKKIDEAYKLMPNEVDPEILAMKRGYDRLAANYAGRAGSEYMKNNLSATTQNAISQAFKYSGGNFNVSSLKDIYHQGLFGVNQQNQQAQLAMMERSSAIQDAMSQRKLEIQMANEQQKMAEGTSQKQAGYQNLLGALASFSGGTGLSLGSGKSSEAAAGKALAVSGQANANEQYLPNTFIKSNPLLNSSLSTSSAFLKPKYNYSKEMGNPWNKGNALTNSEL